MRSPRFPLSSEQCELLVAFEDAPSLAVLARVMGREVSVVSRQIKRLAEAAPVLEKRGGRWSITPLGRRVAGWSRQAMATVQQLVDEEPRASTGPDAAIDDHAALLLVGCQQGFHDPRWGTRNNAGAEANIAALLADWRAAARPVVHVRHRSRERGSPLRAGAAGYGFLPGLAPLRDELVIDKPGASAFVDTALAERLHERGVGPLVVVGFTLNHCVDATVRSAADLGFDVILVADASVSFDRVDPAGRPLAAETLHAAALACLREEFAAIAPTAVLLRGVVTAPPRHAPMR